MDFFKYLQNQSVKRFAILALICFILYELRGLLNIILLTFVITYLVDRLNNFLTRQLNRAFFINKKVVLSIIYLSLAIGLVVLFYKLLPIVIEQIGQLIRLVLTIYHEQQNSDWFHSLAPMLQSVNVEGYARQGFDFVLKISNWGFNLFLALILSLFFLLEKEKVGKFTVKFRTSKISWLFNELEYFGKKFVHTFGKVIEAQFLIALINSFLSSIALWLLGFPQLFGLGLMIFVLGLIPVAGVIISLIPLCTIGYSIGGLPTILYVLGMIAVLHCLEAYVLNPKLMSAKTNLPIFYTFVILTLSEHFFGVWGLIIGIPTFVFLLDILDVEPLPVTSRLKMPKEKI